MASSRRQTARSASRSRHPSGVSSKAPFGALATRPLSTSCASAFVNAPPSTGHALSVACSAARSDGARNGPPSSDDRMKSR
jgi:hypothetical protein